VRALVTGGTGMLGSRVARLLVAAGWDVRVAYRPGDPIDAVRDLPVALHPADLLDDAALTAAVRGVDAVFHTAALVTFDPRRRAQQRRVNVEGTERLLAAARAAGVARLVHTSTVNTLGVPPAGAPGDEDTPCDWAPFGVGYMDSKKAAEDRVLQAAREGLDAVVVLPGTLFGPEDRNDNAGSYLRLVAATPVVPALPGGTTAAHVDDVARGHLLAFERGRRGRRYVLGGEPLSYAALFALVAAALGLRRTILPLPAGLLRAAGRAADRLPARLWAAAGAAPPFAEGLARAATAGLYYSSARAERELRWTWRPAADAIRDAVAWYRATGRLTRGAGHGPQGT
jgi:dihydroflavonol-4-reductase